MSLIKKFASVGSATLASRILGFVREALMAAALGAGPITDAFYAAFRFPNLFRRVFAEGAFNAAFIPLFAKEMEGGGKESAYQFALDVLAVLITVLIGFSALAMIFMPFLISTIVAPGFVGNPEKFDLTVLMTRIMFPYLACMSLVAMLSGILNSMRNFFLAAIVPTLLNLIMSVALFVALWFGMADRDIGLFVSWSVVISGFAQAGMLWVAVRRYGFHMRLRRPRLTPEVKRLLVLMLPAIVTGGVTQINLLIGQIIASSQDKAISILNYADRISQLPLGVIGVAVGVVLLPELSRSLKAGHHADALHLQNRSLEFALALTLPAAVGLMILPQPIISLLYERGEFNAADTQMTAMALAAFASGLPAFVLLKVFQPSFFAREDMRTPMWLSILSVVVNVALSLALFPTLGFVAIALATSISSWMNAVLLAGILWMRSDFRPSATSLKRIAMIMASSALMGLLVWWLDRVLITPAAGGYGYLLWALSIVATITAGALVYFTALILTNGIDRQELRAALKRRKTAPAKG